MPVMQALGEGWDVTVITDASGAVSVEAHEVAIQRMIAAGANMMTWLALAAEWQRDRNSGQVDGSAHAARCG
jgi:nicotinamidase-related amidase